ncbi:MAG TPA: type II secretion system minor pseudopilin GspJ [Allosphingosinicella sp.]|nr:type II secretion system minor pseudopilin GspJ [Allosphingosinicella sp.]
MRGKAQNPPQACSGRDREAGFTLVELLVSLMIFGMLSAAGVALLTFSVRAQEIAQVRLGDLAQLRRASTLMAADFGQAAARTHRDENGSPLPAFVGSNGGAGLVRRGWENVDGAARSSLQRVEYRVAAGRLERLSWPMVDGAPPRAAVILLDDVRSVAFRYRAPTGEWRDRWDPEEPGDLPLAVELVVDTQASGETRQLFLTGRGW